METVGIKETMELLKGLGELAIAVKKIAEDGKVSLSDLPLLISEFQKGAMFVDAFKGLDGIPAEFKDLSGDEAQQLLSQVLQIVADFKAA